MGKRINSIITIIEKLDIILPKYNESLLIGAKSNRSKWFSPGSEAIACASPVVLPTTIAIQNIAGPIVTNILGVGLVPKLNINIISNENEKIDARISLLRDSVSMSFQTIL